MPPDLQLIVNAARSAPAEIASDVLMRIVDSPRTVRSQWRRDLLEEAFRMAAGARQKYKRDYLGGVIDTRTGYMFNAMNLNRDSLSLQCRAVRLMIKLDPKRARELFALIPRPQLQPLECQDTLLYDLSGLYETLKEVALKTFSATELKRNEQWRFVVPYLDDINTVAKIAPAAHLIVSLNPPAPWFEAFVRAFSKALEAISGDDRSFSSGRLLDPVYELSEACRRRDVAADELLRAFRSYLVTNLTAARCADTPTIAGLKKQIDSFNKLLLAASQDGGRSYTLIDTEDLRAENREGVARFDYYWRSPKARDLLRLAQEMNGNPGRPVSDADKAGKQWQWQLSQLLDAIATWNAEDEQSEADFFHQKAVVLGHLVTIVPSGPIRDNILSAFVAFLGSSRMQYESPIEWLLYAQPLVDQADKEPGPERLKLLDALSRSGSSSLYLYAELERWLRPAAPDGR